MLEENTLVAPRYLKVDEVAKVTGLSRATVYRKVKEGLFPLPVKTGFNSHSGWRMSDIDKWHEGLYATEADETQ